MKKLILALIVVVSSLGSAKTLTGAPSITETYPHLADLTFKEPRSNFYLGFGLAPIGVLHGRTMFAINFFQLHWIRDYWDVEIMNASYGVTLAQPSYLESRHFQFRFSPKMRFFKMLSVGPLFGYEFVSFPGINTKIFKAPYGSQNYEPFSSKGPMYGAMLSETFTIWTDYILKLNQAYIFQTYSTQKTEDGWDYLYEKREIRTDKSSIEADTIILFELSLLF